MLVALMGDWHLADRPPSSCTDDYLEDLFGLGDQVLAVARERNVQAIIQAGDWFHIKMPSRNSHKLVIRSIEWAASAPCPVYVTPGNHDLSNNRLASLDEGQPLGAVIRSKHVKMLQGWAEGPLEHSVYGVPWLQDWDTSEDIADKAVDGALASWHEKHDGSVPALIVTHAPFYPPGKEPKYENAEVYYPEKFALHMGGHGSVYYGHVHDPHGEYVVGGVRFCNNGALSRGSLTESNATRQVGVTLWDTVTGKFEFVPLDAKPASQIYRLKEIGEVKSAQADLDAFLASIGQTSIEVTSIEAVLDHVKKLDLDSSVVEAIESLLVDAGAGML